MPRGVKKEAERKFERTQRFVFEENNEDLVYTKEQYKQGDVIPTGFKVGDDIPETILSSADDIGLEDFINGAMWDTKNKRTNPKAKTVLKQLIDFADEMGYDTDPKSPTYIMKTKMTDLVGVNATYRDFFQDFAQYLDEKGAKGIGSTFGSLKTGANAFKEVALANIDIDSGIFKGLEGNYTKKGVGQKAPFILSKQAIYQRSMAADLFNTFMSRIENDLDSFRDIVNNPDSTPEEVKLNQYKINKLEAGRDLSVLLMSTGLRSGEALSLNWYNFDVNQTHPDNLNMSTFRKVFDDVSQTFKYQIYIPSDIIKTRKPLMIEVGETLGKMLEERAETAREMGSRQLFAVENPTSRGNKVSEAFDYKTLKEKSVAKSTIFGANGYSSGIEDVSYVPRGQVTVDSFTAHDLRRFYATVARNFANSLDDPISAGHFVSYTQGRMGSAIPEIEFNTYNMGTPYMAVAGGKLGTFLDNFFDNLVQAEDKGVSEFRNMLRKRNFRFFDKNKASEQNIKGTNTTLSEEQRKIKAESATRVGMTQADLDNMLLQSENSLKADLGLQPDPEETKVETKTKGAGKKALKATALGVAGTVATSGIAKALPILGPAAGVYEAGVTAATPTEEFDVEGAILPPELRQTIRGGLDVASGVSPLPTDLSLLNLAPESIRGDNTFRTLSQILVPTKSEKQQQDEVERELAEKRASQLDSIEDDTTSISTDEQMNNLFN